MAEVITLAAAFDRGPPPEGRLSIPILNRESAEVRLYAPQGQDPQTPHDLDELYFVGSGSARIYTEDGPHEINSGCCIFVPAKEVHYFADMSPDFAVWVVFYGPPGGETE